jgi:cAMP-dependent protein kinase regulator
LNIIVYKNIGLTIVEKEELRNLRSQIKKYRELERANDNTTHDEEYHSASDQSDDEHVPEIDLSKVRERLSLPRIAVSAEVYGEFNTKKQFVPTFIKKTDDQKTQIKLRLLNSFLFNSLDRHDLEIVIDAMEEKIYSQNEEVIKQGDMGDCLYVVDSGELNCFKRFVRM